MRQRTTKTDAGVYDAECECGWSSTGWSRKKDADERRGQHNDEHDTNEPMPELTKFRAGRD